MNPLVSVIIPCYNQDQYLAEALQSVLLQTYSNWECVIINDGSPDNTEEVVQEWLVKDARFKYRKKENGGVSSARNFGINNANGTFILPLDADDKISSNYLELAIHEFQKDNSLKVVYSVAEKIGAESGCWQLPKYDIAKLGLYNMIFCSALYKKEDWERVGGYDVNMILGLEDWEFWIAVLKDGGSVFQLNHIGFYYRIKEKSRQVDLRISDKKELFEYMSIKHADFYVKYLGSFIALDQELNILKKAKSLKGKRKVFNLFCKTFLGFYVFKSK